MNLPTAQRPELRDPGALAFAAIVKAIPQLATFLAAHRATTEAGAGRRHWSRGTL